MKTTIELPDSLAREAKEVASSTGTTLRDLVVSGLRSEVSRRLHSRRIDFAFPTQDGDGMIDGLTSSDAISRGYGLPE